MVYKNIYIHISCLAKSFSASFCPLPYLWIMVLVSASQKMSRVWWSCGVGVLVGNVSMAFTVVRLASLASGCFLPGPSTASLLTVSTHSCHGALPPKPSVHVSSSQSSRRTSSRCLPEQSKLSSKPWRQSTCYVFVPSS